LDPSRVLSSFNKNFAQKCKWSKQLTVDFRRSPTAANQLLNSSSQYTFDDIDIWYCHIFNLLPFLLQYLTIPKFVKPG